MVGGWCNACGKVMKVLCEKPEYQYYVLIRKVRFMGYILRALWGATGVRNWIVAGIIYIIMTTYCAIKLAAACFLYVGICMVCIYTVYSVQVCIRQQPPTVFHQAVANGFFSNDIGACMQTITSPTPVLDLGENLTHNNKELSGRPAQHV